MAAVSHSRSPSEATTASSASGSSYSIILDHLLQYPGTYEIPLRTMYTLNCAPRAQPMPKRNCGGSTISAQDPNSSAANFTNALMSQMSQLPMQPASLPPSFIVSFVRRCFQPNLNLVDFPQALTAMDYLKDLETRRRREVAAALRRLGIDASLMGEQENEVASKLPQGVSDWFRTMEMKEKKVEALYTQVYLGLRRWVLINELSLTPFNKSNCIAMLNTLYPPITSSLPTSLLTPEILKKQRDGFFRYIRGVEKRGPEILKTVVEQGKADGDENGWNAVQDSLDKYLSIATLIIDDCMDVRGVEQFTVSGEESKRNGRKVDSGVSFQSDRRPSSGSSSEISAETGKISAALTEEYKTTYRGLTKLERITREFRRMRMRSRIEADEIVIRPDNASSPITENAVTESEKDVPRTPERKSSDNTLRKKRSLSSLSQIKVNNSSSTSLSSRPHTSTIPEFDKEEMKRHRTIYEANWARGTIAARKN